MIGKVKLGYLYRVYHKDSPSKAEIMYVTAIEESYSSFSGITLYGANWDNALDEEENWNTNWSVFDGTGYWDAHEIGPGKDYPEYFL